MPLTPPAQPAPPPSPIRTILVQAEPTAAGQQRLAVAADVARRHGATLFGMHVAEFRVRVPRLGRLNHRDQFAPTAGYDDAVQARRTFDAVARDAAAPAMQWIEAGDDDPQQLFVRQACLADLTVLARQAIDSPRSASAPARFAERVLLASGRPALVLPATPENTTPDAANARTIVIGWDGSAHAARAMHTALPWLRRAQAVHTLEAPELFAAPPDGALDVARYLLLHGVAVTRHCKRAPSEDAGAALLALVDQVGADLLVMGCFGRSRAAEWLFGGASRSVLGSARVALWMAH